MISIYDLTKEQLFEIANIATGGYLFSKCASDIREVGTGGYGRRRQVRFTLIRDSWGIKEEHHFEINAEAKDRGWHWYSWETDSSGKEHDIHCLNAAAIVDYCDKNNIDVRNINQNDKL